MINKYTLAVLILLVPLICLSDDSGLRIILPTTPILVEPIDAEPVAPPKPTPIQTVVTNLPFDTWYVVQSKDKLTILDSPKGYMIIKEFDGKVGNNFIGRFVDGNGRLDEVRTYQPSEEYVFLYAIKANKVGTAELLFIPPNVLTDKDVTRQTLTLTNKAPNPPPNPDDTDPDTPKPPKPPEPVTSFRVIFVKESGATLPVSQSSIPAAKVIRDYLKEVATPEGGLVGWREYDPDIIVDNEQPLMKELWLTVKPNITKIPCMVIEVNGNATVMPLPMTVEETLTVLKKYRG